MAKIVIEIPQKAMDIVTDALAAYGGAQGKNGGSKGDRALGALRAFIGQTVRQYRIAQAQAKIEVDYQAAQEEAAREGKELEDSLNTKEEKEETVNGRDGNH